MNIIAITYLAILAKRQLYCILYSLKIVEIKYQSILNKKSREAKENLENLPL